MHRSQLPEEEREEVERELEAARKPTDDPEDEPEDSVMARICRTILDQGHLLPVGKEARPVIWTLDYTLRLTPVPDLLLLCDNVDTYQYTYVGCKVANPGSFFTDSTFMTYYPGQRQVERCKV